MAEPIKTKGREELAALKKRVLRQYASGNIDKPVCDRLVSKIDNLDADIVTIDERIPARLRKRHI